MSLLPAVILPEAPASYCYYCPPKSVARKAALLAQIADAKLDKALALGGAEVVRKIARLYDLLDAADPHDDDPDCPVKCRWIKDGVVETLEEVASLAPADVKPPEKNIRSWFLPDGTMEDDPGAKENDPGPEVKRLWASKGNHSMGVIPVDKCQQILAAVAALPEGHADGDLLKAEMAECPLGELVGTRPDVLLATARVKGDCLPEMFRKEILKAYSVDRLLDGMDQRERQIQIDKDTSVSELEAASG
jgi:hypothetical protein